MRHGDPGGVDVGVAREVSGSYHRLRLLAEPAIYVSCIDFLTSRQSHYVSNTTGQLFLGLWVL